MRSASRVSTDRVGGCGGVGSQAGKARAGLGLGGSVGAGESAPGVIGVMPFEGRREPVLTVPTQFQFPL